MNASDTSPAYDAQQLVPGEGWHCSHFFYQWDRQVLYTLPAGQIREGKQQICDALSASDSSSSQSADRPLRIQTGVTSGHKADFSVMLMDPDPLKIESVHQSIMASQLGMALRPTWSYVSISEISEYVQSIDQYREKLLAGGEPAEAVEKKVAAYEPRLARMNVQRLTPVFPDYPVSCFYPMNKWRYPGANWFTLSTSERHKLMSEHARSGIKFAGKVSQLITVGIGLDDWEWGVTLWGTNPKHLKQIVYDMRFDEASAKYAEFGPFYTSYVMDAERMMAFCKV